jgi:hypothetical protein
VAESIRFYRYHFWPSLALGIGPAILALVVSEVGGRPIAAVAAGVWAVISTASFVAASVLVDDKRPTREALLTATAAGVVVGLPVPFLAVAFVIPALAWLALFGLAVPVAVIERAGLRESFTRAIALARADYVHALGSLATLAIVFVLTQSVLFFLLRGAGEATTRIAALLASLFVSPLLFIGAALLYFDQAARLGSRRSRSERSAHADVPDALDADRPGSADAAVESRSAAGGQPRR